MIVCLEQQLQGIHDDFGKNLNGKEHIIGRSTPGSKGSLKTPIPVHLLSCKAWDIFLKVNGATIGPTELANMLDLLSDAKNVTFANTYL